MMNKMTLMIDVFKGMFLQSMPYTVLRQQTTGHVQTIFFHLVFCIDVLKCLFTWKVFLDAAIFAQALQNTLFSIHEAQILRKTLFLLKTY